MKHLYIYVGLAALSFLIILLAACATGTLPTALTVISDACAAANVTVPILEASGVIPSPVANVILTYTSATATAAAQASQELLSTDPASVQAAKIIGDFAAVAIPSLGPTVGPEAQAIVQAIEAAVNLFVNQFKSPTVQKALRSGALDHQKLGYWDRHKLGGMQKKFTDLAAESKALMK